MRDWGGWVGGWDWHRERCDGGRTGMESGMEMASASGSGSEGVRQMQRERACARGVGVGGGGGSRAVQ